MTLCQLHIQYSANGWTIKNKNLGECKSKLLCYDIHTKGSTQKNKSRWLVSISDFELCTKKDIKQQWFILYGLAKGYILKETTVSTSTSNLKTVAIHSCKILLLSHQITLHHIPEVIHPTTKKTQICVVVSLFNCCQTQSGVWNITS